jgi:hypothetical protein
MGGLAVVDRLGEWVRVVGRPGVVLVLCVGLGACQAAETGSDDSSTASSTGWVAGGPVATGDAPVGLVADGPAVLVVHNYAQTVVRVGADHRVTALAEGPDGPSHPPLAFGSLWVVLPNAGDPVTVGNAEYTQNAVGRLDSETGQMQAQLPAGAQFLAASPDQVWAVGGHGEESWVWRIDPTDNSVTALPGALDPEVPGRVAAVAYGRDRLWVALYGTQWGAPSRVVTIDPSTGASERLPARIPEEMIINDMALTDTGVALIGTDLTSEVPHGILVLLDASGATVGDVQMGRGLTGITLTGDGLWISDCLDGTLTLLDPATGTPRGQPVQVGTAYPPDEPLDWNREDYSCPGAITQAEDTLWVTAWNDDAIIPVQPPQLTQPR